MKRASALFVVAIIAFQLAGGGWLGILVQDLTPRVVRRYGLRVKEGVLVTRVQFNSPAMRGGIKDGDVVISLNNKKIRDAKSLKKAVSGLSPGHSVEIVVLRDRRNKTLKIVLGATQRDAA